MASRNCKKVFHALSMAVCASFLRWHDIEWDASFIKLRIAFALKPLVC